MTGAEAATELHVLTELDRELFTIEEDFFRRLAETAEKGPEAVNAVFGDYARIVDEWMEDARREDVGIPLDTLSAWRETLERYRRFLTGQRASAAETLSYSYKELQKNFRRRLRTQDRMSEGKALFFPISLIDSLFSKATRVGYTVESFGCTPRHWFREWLDSRIACIRVITSGGECRMSDVNRLLISTTRREVQVVLNNGAQAALCSRTASEGMHMVNVARLEDIQIRNFPSMKEFLEEHAASFPACQRLTTIIREVAKENGLKIITNNIKLLNSLVISVQGDRLFSLLPALQKELELVREETMLVLAGSGKRGK